MEEKLAVVASLPTEIWELILVLFDQKDLVRLRRTCHEFKNLIDSNQHFSSLISLPSFDPRRSPNCISLSEDNRCATKTKKDFDSLLSVVVNTNTSIVHFKINNLQTAVTHFQLAAFTPAANPSDNNTWDFILLRDGTAGSKNDYFVCRRETLESCNIKTGDIISIKIGRFDSKQGNPFPKRLDIIPKFMRRPQGAIPYVIVWKNGKIVHDPFILVPSSWPLQIGAWLQDQNDSIQIVNPVDYNIKLESPYKRNTK